MTLNFQFCFHCLWTLGLHMCITKPGTMTYWVLNPGPHAWYACTMNWATSLVYQWTLVKSRELLFNTSKWLLCCIQTLPSVYWEPRRQWSHVIRYGQALPETPHFYYWFCLFVCFVGLFVWPHSHMTPYEPTVEAGLCCFTSFFVCFVSATLSVPFLFL